MSRLLLLRHARAAWPQPGMCDFDRPLEETGIADAERIGAAMAERKLVPDKVLCSSAKRARQTWDGCAPHLPGTEVIYLDTLYKTDPAGYLELVRSTTDASSLLVIGHNPMMEELALGLSVRGDSDAMAIASSGFPAGGLAVLRFSSPLKEIVQEDGYLELFLRPRAY